MGKKYWIVIIIFSVLVAGVLYSYFNYQSAKIEPSPNVEKAIEKTKTEDEGMQSIKLEKPPFIKD